MITYINDIGKAYVEHYDLYGFLQECGQLAANGYTLCVENEYFCRNIGGNYLAYYDEPAYLDNKQSKAEAERDCLEKSVHMAIADIASLQERLTETEKERDFFKSQLEATAGGDKPPIIIDIPFSTESLKILEESGQTSPETVAAVLEKIANAGIGADEVPSDVNTAVTPPAESAPTEEPKEDTPRRRGRPPRN